MTMAEDNQAGTEEKANSNGTEEKTTFSLNEVNEMKKSFFDKDEGVQTLLRKSKMSEQALDEVGKVSESKEYLIDLFEENPEVATIILEKYYEGKSIDEYKISIDYKIDNTDPKVIARMVKSEAKKLANQELIEGKKTEFVKKLKMSEEEKKSFDEAFDERIHLKSFNISNLNKHLEKAYGDVNDDTDTLKEMKKQEAIGNALATGNGQGGKQIVTQKDATKQKNSEYNKIFLKERGII